jgi:hypothetical protein
MPHEIGTHLGGISCIDTLRARCVVDPDTCCWHLRKASGAAMPRDKVHRVWVHGRGVLSATRAAWELKRGVVVERGLVVSRACKGYDCVNPAHLRCWTKAQEGEHLRRTKRLRNQAGRYIANTVNGRRRAKLTPELAQWARESEQSIMDAAHGLGVSPSRVGYIRAGSAWRTKAAPSVFDWMPT